jgi:radical SAM protein with 4Fe4S-binding SPASM domain
MTCDASNICQLRCPLCPTGQGLPGREKKNMPFALFKKVIDELSPFAYGVTLHNWGEPLLNPDLCKMVKYACGKRLITDISTNFQVHLEKQDFDNLVSSGLHHLVVSLDGASPGAYQKYRIAGDFERVIQNIKGIVEAKKRLASRLPVITLQFLVNKHNEAQIEKIKQLAGELKVDNLALNPIMVNIKDDAEFREWLPQDENYSCYDYRRRTKKKKIKNCNWPWFQAVINPDGAVSPCCHVYHPSTDLGNVQNKTFRSIWNSEYFRKLRRFLKEKKDAQGIVCALCLKPYLDSADKEAIDLVNESLTNKLVIACLPAGRVHGN